MSHPDPTREYHSDLIFADQQTELGYCAICGMIQARHLFEVIPWDEAGNNILACHECVKQENLHAE